MSLSLRPFYFTVVFWGAAYRGYFTDLLLASLLSPNNIPALQKSRRNKFLIVTTREDWQALQTHPTFVRMRQYLEPEWLEMPFPQPHELKMLVMSRGHKLVATRAFEDQAYGVFVTPDLILSDGSVAAMERLAGEGKKVVLSVAIRFRHETLLPEMDREGYLKAGEPLTISSRDLMRLALRNLHSETLRYEFNAPYFANCPVSVYWWVPGGSGMIIYSFSWAPLVVDYGALHEHDTRTFEDWTLDGDYIYRNFPNHEDVHVVTDSDDIALVSFTKEADLHFDLVPDSKMKCAGVFTTAYKVGLIRALWKSSVMDPLKRDIFVKPVYLHSAGIDTKWSEKRTGTDVLIQKALRLSSLEERFMADVCVMGGQSRFAGWVLRKFSDEAEMANSHRMWLLTICVWLILVWPQRIARRVISRLLQPVRRVASQGRWMWRYRRFVWCRVKEELGLAQGQHHDWTDPRWVQSAWSPKNLMFTLRRLWEQVLRPPFALLWVWQYRRFVWTRLKEKLGWIPAQHHNWRDPHWLDPGVSLVCPLFTIRWMWRNRQWRLLRPLFALQWIWQYRRFVWWRLKEKLGWVQERHYDWMEPHWTKPGLTLVCPLFTIRWMWRNRRWLVKHRKSVKETLNRLQAGTLEKDGESLPH